MEEVRFEKFALLIDAMQKCIQKFKTVIACRFGVKSVHVLWIYELLIHPDGLTSAELATKSNIDPSLISRELASLKRKGYITRETAEGKRSYNSRITLTDSGRELASRISDLAVSIQRDVGFGIKPEELSVFYSVLERLHDNFTNHIKESEKKE